MLTGTFLMLSCEVLVIVHEQSQVHSWGDYSGI